jgi:uncharacterized membrane protein YozB (DUF420 family)
MTVSEPARTGLRTPRLVVAILGVGVVAVPVLAYPYVLMDRSLSRIDVATQLLYAVLVVHVLTASVCLLLGALQLVPRVRADPARHRAIGRLFLTLGTLAFALTGIPLAITTPDGDLTRYGVLVPAVLWPVLAVLGFRAIRRGDVVGHREWMVRLYALTFFALTTRMLVPLMLLAQIPVMDRWYDGDVPTAVAASIPVGQWLGWIVDLALAEVVIRRWRRLGGPLR